MTETRGVRQRKVKIERTNLPVVYQRREASVCPFGHWDLSF